MTSSTGATLADNCPRRRSSTPLAPSSSKRRLKRRKVRSLTPNASAASCCDSRPICHPSYRSANLICLISSSTRVRFMSLLLEDHLEPDNSCATYTGQMMCYLHIGMSDLTDDEIAVIAEHEQVPAIVAAELGHGLLKTPKGVFILKGYISDVLEQAK